MSTIQQIPWEAIKKIALLGTDRSTLSDSFTELVAGLGTDLDQREDKIFLDGLTQLSLLYRTARKFPAADDNTAPNALPTALSPPPLEVAQMLRPILEGKFEAILPEYLRCLAHRKWSFPPDQLPNFLNECLEQPSLWESVAAHIGPTAHWLIALNPSWQRLQSTPKEKDWQSKFAIDRLRYYAKIRQQDPAKAADLLRPEWVDFKVSTKVDFLKIIAENPTPAELAFIEELSFEKSKKTNLALFKIMATNPQSKLVASSIQYFLNNNIFSTSKKEKTVLKINLPTTDEVADLNLIPQHPDFSGGLRANNLAQIVFLLPLDFIEKELDRTPAEIIPLFLKNEWALNLIQAVLLKSILTKNQKWLAALFINYLEEEEEISLWNDTIINEIFTCLEAGTFSALVHYGLKKGFMILDSENAFVALLLGYNEPWPDEVSFSFFKTVKLWLQKNPRYLEGWYIWQIFRKAAFQIDPRQLPVYHKAFNSSAVWGLAEEEIQNLLEVLNFRFRLYKKYS